MSKLNDEMLNTGLAAAKDEVDIRDFLLRTNEVLEDLQWQGVPVRKTERISLPEPSWTQVVFGRELVYPKGAASRSRRIKWWFRKWSERISDAHKVLTGELVAVDPNDGW